MAESVNCTLFCFSFGLFVCFLKFFVVVFEICNVNTNIENVVAKTACER